MNKRGKGPRAVIVAELANMARMIKTAGVHWKGHMSTNIIDGESRRWRKRRPEELAENIPARWDALARDMEELAHSVDLIAQTARAQAAELRRLQDQ